MRLIPVLLAVLSVLVAPAQAETLADAQALYNDGAFDAAARAARALDTSAGYTLAARAVNAIVYFEPDRGRAKTLAKAAEDDAEAALDLDPDNVEAHLQRALAFAARGARISPFKAAVLRLAARAKDEIDTALALAPGDAWALSTAAGWNVEVARRGGARLYGADADRGVALFDAALNADPDNLVIAYECALRLSGLGRADLAPRVDAALARALALTPRNAFEARVQARAQAFATARTAGPQALAAFIEAHP